MATLADAFGPMPALVPSAVGVGAGGRDPEGHANVLRLLVGSDTGPAPVEAAVVLEANVDDLDPRLWPGVLAALLDAGASDAWLTPILMKKGRPAHTLSVLCPPALADALAEVVLTHTSSIGLRRQRLDKLVLDRETVEVDLDGATVRVKLARLHGRVVNAVPEFDDVARVAPSGACRRRPCSPRRSPPRPGCVGDRSSGSVAARYAGPIGCRFAYIP